MKIHVTLLASTCVAWAVLSSSSSADTLAIPGDANIFGAGHSTAPDPDGHGGGALPPSVSFTAGANEVVTFSSVTGSVTLNGSTFNDPDGVGSQASSTDIASYQGISGIMAPNAGFLIGVFETNVEPADPAPAILDFTTIGTNFTTLSPAIDQTFFIGDGLTGDGTGTQQQFIVPADATALYLGIGDNLNPGDPPGYYSDNGGSFNATFNVVPEPSSFALVGIGLTLCLFRVRVCKGQLRLRWSGSTPHT